MAIENMSSLAIKDLIARYEMELSKLAFQTAKTEQTVSELREALREVARQEEESRRAYLSGDAAGSNGSSGDATLDMGMDMPASGLQEAESSSPEAESTAGSEAAADDSESESEAPQKRGRRPRLKATPPKPAGEQRPERSSDEAPKKSKRGRKSTKGGKKAKATAEAANGGGKGNKGDRSRGYRLSDTDEMIFKALEDTGKVLITNEIQDYLENAFREQGDEKSSEEVRLLISRSLQKLANRRNDLIKVPYEGRGYAYARPEWVNKDGELKRKYNR